MVMLCTDVNAELFEHFCAEGVLGEHALDCLVHDEFGLFSHQFLVLDLFESADVTCVITIVFVLEFLASENDLFAVDYDNMVAAVDVGSVLGFVLPFKDRSNLRRKAAENHIGCVDNVPLASTSPGFAI